MFKVVWLVDYGYIIVVYRICNGVCVGIIVLVVIGIKVWICVGDDYLVVVIIVGVGDIDVIRCYIFVQFFGSYCQGYVVFYNKVEFDGCVLGVQVDQVVQ